MGITEIDVWLDVGRAGRRFTYQDGNNLGVALGDIVLVRLNGRPMHGLVVNIENFSQHSKKDSFDQNKKFAYKK